MRVILPLPPERGTSRAQAPQPASRGDGRMPPS